VTARLVVCDELFVRSGASRSVSPVAPACCCRLSLAQVFKGDVVALRKGKEQLRAAVRANKSETNPEKISMWL
jgi:hypothetical protein